MRYAYPALTALAVVLAASSAPSPLADDQIAVAIAAPAITWIGFGLFEIHSSDTRPRLQRAWSGFLWALTGGVFAAWVFCPEAARYALAAAVTLAIVTRRVAVPRAVQRVFQYSYDDARAKLLRTTGQGRW